MADSLAGGTSPAPTSRECGPARVLAETSWSDASASMREGHPVDSTDGCCDRESSAQLLPLMYEDLHRLAVSRLRREAPGQTLQPTALVHEAYLRLVDARRAEPWDSPGHFFAAAAEAMRRILVEAARRKSRLKRGGGLQRVDLGDHPASDRDQDLVALDEALDRLAEEDPLAAKVVELRQFAGLGHESVASALGITVYQARQKWTYARAWLRDAISG